MLAVLTFWQYADLSSFRTLQFTFRGNHVRFLWKAAIRLSLLPSSAIGT